MITALNAFTNDFALSINFVAHTLIFVGTFYVAIHNRRLPQWHVTPLWYVGLCSLFVSISIVLQWGIGPEFPLSYWNAGILGETLVNIALAAISTIMLIGTIKTDIKNKKNRKE